jgi:protein-histidine pros-kinase
VQRERAGGFADAVVVCVRDDGKGLDEAGAARTGRFGVAGMRERVQAFGGSFAIAGAVGEGVTVRAVLPVAAAEREERLETRA